MSTDRAGGGSQELPSESPRPTSEPGPKAPWRIGALLQEGISHAILFGVLVASGLNFSGALLLLVAELLLIMLLSTPVHRADSVGYDWRRLLLLLAILAFLLLMCSVAYGVAIQGQDLRLDAAFLARVFAFEPKMLGWMIVLSALHLAVMLVYAWTQPEPRKAWDRITAVASVGTLVSLFLLTFVILLLGEPAIAFARRFDPAVDAEAVLIALMVGHRLLWCCLLMRVPNSALAHQARG